MVVKNKISKKKVKKISLRKSNINKSTTKGSKKKKTKKKISKEKIKQNIKKSYRNKKKRRSSTKKEKVKKTTQKKKNKKIKKKIRVVNKKYLKKMRISRLKSKRKRGLRIYTKKRRQKGGSTQKKKKKRETSWMLAQKEAAMYLSDAGNAWLRSGKERPKTKEALERIKNENIRNKEITEIHETEIEAIRITVSQPDSVIEYDPEYDPTILKNNPIDPVQSIESNAVRSAVFELKEWDALRDKSFDELLRNVQDPKPAHEDVIDHGLTVDNITTQINNRSLYPINDELADFLEPSEVDSATAGEENYDFLNRVLSEIALGDEGITLKGGQVGGGVIIPLNQSNFPIHSTLTRMWDDNYPQAWDALAGPLKTSLSSCCASASAASSSAAISNLMFKHHVNHIYRLDTFHDFGKGDRKSAAPKGVNVALKLGLSILFPNTYREVTTYLNEGLFVGARRILQDLNIPRSGSWEKQLREYTFANFSSNMKCVPIPCKGKGIQEIYANLKQYNFGIILEEERLNKSGGILQQDHAYKIAKLFAAKMFLDVEMFGSMACWYDPGSGTSQQMISFFKYVYVSLTDISQTIDSLLETLITMPPEALYGIENMVDIRLWSLSTDSAAVVNHIKSNIDDPLFLVSDLRLALIYKPSTLCGFVHKVSVNIIFQIMILIFFLYNNVLLDSFLTNIITQTHFDIILQQYQTTNPSNIVKKQVEILRMLLSPITDSAGKKKETIQTILTLFGHIKNNAPPATSMDDLVAKYVQILLILKRAGDYGQLIGLKKFKDEAKPLLNLELTTPLRNENLIEILKKFANPVFESMDNALISAAHSIGMYTLTKNITSELDTLNLYISKEHWINSNNPNKMLALSINEVLIIYEEYSQFINSTSWSWRSSAGTARATQLEQTLFYAITSEVAKDLPDAAFVAALTAERDSELAVAAAAAAAGITTVATSAQSARMSALSDLSKKMYTFLKIIKILKKIKEHEEEEVISRSYQKVFAALSAAAATMRDYIVGISPLTSVRGGGLNHLCYAITELFTSLIKIKNIKNISYFDQTHFNESNDLYNELSLCLVAAPVLSAPLLSATPALALPDANGKILVTNPLVYVQNSNLEVLKTTQLYINTSIETLLPKSSLWAIQDIAVEKAKVVYSEFNKLIPAITIEAYGSA